MALKVLAQNGLDAFSKSATAAEFLLLMKQLQPDVAVFPEAYDASQPALVGDTVQQFETMGYHVLHGDYDDADERKVRQGLIAVARRELVSADTPGRLVRIGGRTMAEFWLTDPATQHRVHVWGLHLNDRSEALRQAELTDLLQRVQPDGPTIIAGDFNALYRRDAHGLVITMARCINKLVKLHMFPVSDPVNALHPKKGLGRVGSLSQRLSDMASGETMSRLSAAGFTDADLRHRPTHPAKKPIVQLDHIMISSHCNVQTFDLLPKNSSDHLGLLATIG
jgi:endonuclease/exonuclease/phosphatase family metal-dependent hydrolase